MGSSGGGGGAAAALVKIAQVILGVDTASITFAAIPGTYEALWVVGIARATFAAGVSDLGIEINADATLADYQVLRAFDNGAVASVATFDGVAAARRCAAIPGSTAPANSFADVDVLLVGYAGARLKTWTGQFNSARAASAASGGTYSGNWDLLDAITELRFFDFNGGNLAAGTRLTLYGISAA